MRKMQKLISAIWNSDERRLRAFWRVAIEMLTAVLLISLVQATIDFGRGPTAFAVVNSTMMCCLLVVALLAARILDRRSIIDFGLRIDRRWILDLIGGVVVGSVMVAIVFLIQYQQGWIEVQRSSLEWRTLLKLQTGWVITTLMVAVAEEIMFRGYQLKNLSEGLSGIKRPFGMIIAVFVGSLVFGAVHGANPNADVVASISILFAGVMFCLGRIYTGSLAAPIGLHFSWNYGIAAVLGLPVSGQVIPGSLLETTAEKNLWTGGDFGPEASPIVILCMAIGTIAFMCWPKKQTSAAENVQQLKTYLPRDSEASMRVPTEET
ncbi:MAG: lysostaphin resistance A-like protein [Planctomycetaceae bacterium]